MSAVNSIVATFSNRHLTETAVKELQDAKFDMSKLSIVSRQPLNIEGLRVVRGIDETASFDSALSGCLPIESLQDYEAELDAGRSILLAYGDAEEMARAKDIIETHHPEGWDGRTDISVYYGCAA